MCSLPKQNELLLVDAKAGKLLGAVPLADPRGLAFDGQGRLLALAGKQLHRYRTLRRRSQAHGCRLPAPEVLVAGGLEDPQHVALDAEGNLYVSDRGNSHQVKVFDPAGKPLRVIGTAGPPKAGPYDPLHMNNPNGLTIDSNGHLWVAETDFQPKRVSVWTLDGRLVRAFYGPSEYGGGGRLDPLDKRRFYFHGMEFQLDWRRGVDRLVRVFFRPGPGELGLPDGFGVDGQPEMPIYRTTAAGVLPLFHELLQQQSDQRRQPGDALAGSPGGVAVPVAALGRANDWSLLKTDAFKPRLPAGVELRNGSLVHGSALRLVGPQRRRPGAAGGGDVPEGLESGGLTVMPDLSVVVSRVDSRAVRYVPQRFTTAGAPVYDLAAAETLVEGAQAPTSSGGDQALVDAERLDGPDRGAQAVRPAIAGRRLSRPAALVVPGPLAGAARLARIASARSAGRADRHHATAGRVRHAAGAAMPGRCGPSTATRGTSTSSRPTACSWPSCSTTSAAAAPGPCPLPSAACG